MNSNKRRQSDAADSNASILMTPHEFTLEYELSRDDMNAYTGFYWASLFLRDWIVYPLAGIIGVGIGLAVITAFYLIVRLTGAQWDAELNAFFPFGAIVGLVLAIYEARRFDKDNVLARLAGMVTKDSKDNVLSIEQELRLGRRTLSVTSHEIEITSPAGKTSRTWEYITHVAATKSHVFIISDVVIIIPRRSFINDTMYSEFIQSVRNWSRQR